MDGDRLPTLPLAEWEATKDTLHLWAQIIGKTRLALMPMRNHWWNVTLYPSARGLTTRRMPVEAHNLEVEIDLVDHRVWARTTESDASFDLHDGLSVAEFHDRLGQMLDGLDVRVDIRAEPFGVPMTTPFAADRDHASYDADAVDPIPARPALERRRVRGVRRVVLRQGQPRSRLLAQLRSRHQPVLRHAGRDTIRRRRGHGRGVLPRDHQFRVLGRGSNQPLPRLLLLHRTRAGRPRAASPSALAGRSGPRKPTVRSPSSATTTSGALPTRGRRCSSSSRARTKPAHHSRAGTSPTRQRNGARFRPTGSPVSPPSPPSPRGRDGRPELDAAQVGLGMGVWGETGPLRARMGLHAGDGELRRDGQYVNQPLNRCARLMAIAHGGQVVVFLIAPGRRRGCRGGSRGRRALDRGQPGGRCRRRGPAPESRRPSAGWRSTLRRALPRRWRRRPA